MSFLLVILMGTLFLKLPFSTKPGVNISLFDCFFTATSTTCISGVVIYDTFTNWSFFGQIVILIMTQLGALGLITFYSIFVIYLNKKIDLKNMRIAGDQISSPNFSNFKSIFKSVLHITLFCELLGGLILSFSFWPKFKFYGIFMAFFTSISAYCNAGIDLNGIFEPNCSFIPFANDYLVLTICSILTFVGGLGFIVINEIIEFKKQHRKLKFLSVHSKIALTSSFVLIILGTIIFLGSEFNNSLANLNIFEKIFSSAFHSISTRSNGFLTLNFNNLTNMSKTFLCVLMLIGACPSGTGGGLKTTTISILFSTMINTIRNRKQVSIFKHKINETDIHKAIATFLLTLIIIATSTMLIYNFETIIELPTIIFSAISVFANTGYQTVPIKTFSLVSKIVLIMLMFIGRIGPLNFVSTFLNHKNHKRISLPEGEVQIS